MDANGNENPGRSARTDMARLSKRLAAIDMGSNSFHLLLAEVSMRGFFPKPRIIARYKRKVRLADGFDQQYCLNDDSIERAHQCLSEFSQQLQLFKPDAVKAVATAALRKASNKAGVIDKLSSTLGYPIEVIPGEREAELIFSGVCSAAEQKGDILVIDIGGASTEIIVGQPLKPKLLRSLDMGCVVFQNQFFGHGQLSRSGFQQAITAARQQLNHHTEAFQKLGWQHIIGASGTFRAVDEIAIAEGRSRLTRAWLSELIERCIGCGHIERLDFSGLRDDRRAIFCGGLSILYAILCELDINSFEVTNGALREGLLAELVAAETA